MVSRPAEAAVVLTPPILTITPPPATDSSTTNHGCVSGCFNPESCSLQVPLNDSNSIPAEPLTYKNLGFDVEDGLLALPSIAKSASLPRQPIGGRRPSADSPQGGAVFFNRRQIRKSFDLAMLSRGGEESSYLVSSRERSPSPNLEYKDPPSTRVDFCECVVEEILVTEQQYVRDLADIVEGYLDFSRKCAHITEEAINDIFNNIECIYNFQISFLRDLESCDEQPVAIARCFIDRGTEFGIYAQYVTNYPSSIASLTQLLRKPVVNDAYRRQQIILGHGLPLGSYLHKPVQRILKYHLLLQSLLNHFGEGTFGRETITTSLQCMTDCARNINELKRSHEHAMKIQEIQSMLYNFEGYHLMDFGELVHEGDLRMHGARNFRHIYLFEKGVIICKKREDGAMSCKTTIMCENLMLIESIPREPFSFHLIPYDNPRQQNTFQAKTLSQKQEWCARIKKYMLESYNVKIPEKAKELLLTLTGKSDYSKAGKHFMSLTLKHHQTPDYLEKRRKSQTYACLPTGGSLPRTNKRVRKVTTNQRMASPPPHRPISSPLEPQHCDTNSSLTVNACHTPSAPPSVGESQIDGDGAENVHELPLATDGPALPVIRVESTTVCSEVNTQAAVPSHRSTTTAPRDLFSALPSTPRPLRRHSLPNAKATLDVEEVTGMSVVVSYDDESPRAQHLRKLLSERYGLHDPTWSPQIVSAARGCSVALVKRTDSYAKAVQYSTKLAAKVKSELSLDLPANTWKFGKSSTFSDTSSQEELSDEDLKQDSVAGGAKSQKGKSETSILLSKLSQLKERTSNKLSELLRKSPVKLFKDVGELSPSPANLTDKPEVLNKAVGRRLSNFEPISVNEPKKPDSLEDITSSPSLPSCSSTADDTLYSAVYVEVQSSDDGGDFQTLNGQSMESLGEGDSCTLERNSKGCTSSSDNLADVEENECGNGDDETLHLKLIERTTPDYRTESQTATDDERQEIETETTSSVVDADPQVLTCFHSDANKPSDEVWVMLEKSVTTAENQNTTTDEEVDETLSGLNNSAATHLNIVSEAEESSAPVRLPNGNSLTPRPSSKVYQMARKYSRRIKKKEGGNDSTPKGRLHTRKDNSTNRTSNGWKCASDKANRFKDMLDSGDESGDETDFPMHRCEESISPCADLYEQQIMDALESYDDEMRDSAIYSDCEDSRLTQGQAKVTSDAIEGKSVHSTHLSVCNDNVS